MKVNDILQFLEELAPLALQEDYDNSGLQLGDRGSDVQGVMLCLDITLQVLEEAVSKGCSLVISHHPLLFKGVKRISYSDPGTSPIVFAIRNNLNIYSIHTNLDNVPEGVNHALGSKIGLDSMRILSPMAEGLSKLVTFCPSSHAEQVRDALFSAGAGRIGNYDSCSFNMEGLGTFRALEGANPFVGNQNELHFEPEIRIECIFPGYLKNNLLSVLQASHPYEEVAFDIFPLLNDDIWHGAGMLGMLKDPLTPEDFLAHLKSCLGLKVLKHSDTRADKIRKVAICGGAGAFLISAALKAGADAFVTADIKYHQFQEPQGRMLLCDVGHFESEHHVLPQLAALLAEKFPNFAILVSESDQNPVKIFI